VWSKRLKETLAIVTIGDGVVGLLAPRQHSLLWGGTGPESARKIARFFTDNPNYMRLLGVTQISFGVWLAFEQYREG
jgi:hypothetical protein